MKLLFVVVVAATVFGLTKCEDRYRYPCQNPRNWELKECKPPICSVEGTCPDKLLPPEMLIKETDK